LEQWCEDWVVSLSIFCNNSGVKELQFIFKSIFNFSFPIIIKP
jgi:hypothetical protein